MHSSSSVSIEPDLQIACFTPTTVVINLTRAEIKRNMMHKVSSTQNTREEEKLPLFPYTLLCCITLFIMQIRSTRFEIRLPQQRAIRLSGNHICPWQTAAYIQLLHNKITVLAAKQVLYNQ